MQVYESDIPLIRSRWVSARASLRKADSSLGSMNRSAAVLEAAEFDKVTARGVMHMMATLRLQIRHAGLIDRPTPFNPAAQ